MQRTIQLLKLLLPAFLLVTAVSATAVAQDTPRPPGWLATQIDTLLDQSLKDAPSGPVSSDTEWLRRVFLDLAGRIPTATETRQFVADTSTDKRGQQIERLLADPAFSRRMADAFHILLMERRGEHAEWLSYLQRAFAANKPWDVIVREILDPDAGNETTRGAAFFQTRQRLAVIGAGAAVDDETGAVGALDDGFSCGFRQVAGKCQGIGGGSGVGDQFRQTHYRSGVEEM